jgi:hypothetical protein
MQFCFHPSEHIRHLFAFYTTAFPECELTQAMCFSEYLDTLDHPSRYQGLILAIEGLCEHLSPFGMQDC